ncbi:DUF3134 domain-containing protein [Okeania sp. SIO2G5]|uniref:DUF3134 domain-containing protein n=1 Tax=Okeania sp. SIO2G5 TaxID=2607796 RepID=UPI0013C284E0|nr:DUF3134 domain-containing protein [Okeania sp. SIO2G5]NEP76272.1 DUF3134 domain-containing protein [Okeania sp. SIO2G5]
MSYNNPALRAYPRKQHAPVIPLQRDASILEWLERSGRMMERAIDPNFPVEEDEEINALMGNDDSYDDDDDDDDDSLAIDD